MADPAEVEEPEGQAPARNWRKELEGQIKELEGQNSELSRKLAFTEAGYSGLPETRRKALLAVLEGDITAEAVKAKAEELGFGAKDAEAEVESEGTAEVVEELGHLSKFAGAPAPEQGLPATEVIRKGIEDFQGDYQAFTAYVMANADAILQK